MLLDVLPTLTATLTDVPHYTDAFQSLHLPISDRFLQDWIHNSTFLAQQFKEPDLAGDVGKMWQHFVKTGQVWAFIIGMVAGYLVKTFTSFG
ncbi:MAG: hypothetical protein VKJ24_07495 [Synechococcales bacterium]|nr:hypothetical protein [Synechococcales bacterium]